MTTDNGSFSIGELDLSELLPTETWLCQSNKVAATGTTSTTLLSSDHTETMLYKRSDGSTVQEETSEIWEKDVLMSMETLTLISDTFTGTSATMV